MSHIMTKVGTQDNVVTYEHFCDTLEERDSKIEKKYITLGSTCTVINDPSLNGIGIYIADSNKQWHEI